MFKTVEYMHTDTHTHKVLPLQHLKGKFLKTQLAVCCWQIESQFALNSAEFFIPNFINQVLRYVGGDAVCRTKEAISCLL